jgi:ankyrin repeat protein
MNDIDRVRKLVRDGQVVVWEPPPFEQTAVHIAADHGRADIISALLDAGGQTYIDSLANGWTPLGMAARKGHREAVQTLVARGADVNGHDVEHLADTPLSDAVQGGFVEIVEDLVSAGADAAIPGWMNLTALDHARGRYERKSDDVGRRILSALRKAE